MGICITCGSTSTYNLCETCYHELEYTINESQVIQLWSLAEQTEFLYTMLDASLLGRDEEWAYQLNDQITQLEGADES